MRGLLWRHYVTRSKIHRDDCALRLRDGLFASEAVIGVIGLTRTRERGDGGLHRQPPLAEVLLGGSDRVKRRLSMEQIRIASAVKMERSDRTTTMSPVELPLDEVSA